MNQNLLVVLVVAVVLALAYLAFGGVGAIPGAEARRLVGEGAVLVDVRTRSEFSRGHIEGAINIPVQELAERAGELGDKARPVVLYCQSGARSSSAKRVLERDGFAEVHNLGAMSRWD